MATQHAHSQMRVLVERQWGVISRTQLLELGFSAETIFGMRRRGQLLGLSRGVYAVGHRRLTMRGRLHAAQLAAGRKAFLSHHSAAAHRGLCRHPAAVELTIPSGHTPSVGPGLRIHRTTIPIDGIQARPHDGLLTATVPRIITDLARTERPGEIQRLIRESIRTGQFDRRAHPGDRRPSPPPGNRARSGCAASLSAGQ